MDDRGTTNPVALARAAGNDVLRSLLGQVRERVGGRARLQVVGTLAAVLALSGADTATVGAAGPQLQQALHIGRTQIGVLLAVTSVVGALATVPAGILVDRVRRVRLLTVAVLLWGLASGISALSTSFLFLLFTRLGLGIVVAVAGPAVASLLGDFIPGRERSRVYGYVLAGELIGTGFGFIVSGDLAALSWRAAFVALVPPAAAVAWMLTRLSEPARGGREQPADSRVVETSPFRDVEPDHAKVLREDPTQLPLSRAVRYVLGIPSNVVLIVASALGYFFLAGVRGFGVEFVRHHYSLPQAEATALVPIVGLGMLIGVLASGRLADRQLAHGHRTARVTVAALTVLSATVLFVPALLTTSLAVALPLLTLCGVGMGGTNPPLDAARLDVMPPLLWGRAEAIRTVCQTGSQALAPLLFGVLASDVFGGANGLRDTFLVTLIPLALSALLLLTVGRSKYPVDAATAVRSAAG